MSYKVGIRFLGGACGGRGGCTRRVEFPTETPYPTISGGGELLQKLLPTTPTGGNGDDSGLGTDEFAHYPSSYENSTSVCAMGCSYTWGNRATNH